MPHSPNARQACHTSIDTPDAQNQSPSYSNKYLKAVYQPHKPLLPWGPNPGKEDKERGETPYRWIFTCQKKKKTIKWLPLNDYLFKWKEAGVPFCLQLSISPNPVLGGEKLTCKMRSTTENKKATFITQLHLYLFKYWLYSYVNVKGPLCLYQTPKYHLPQLGMVKQTAHPPSLYI